jgi:hypothetical protein
MILEASDLNVAQVLELGFGAVNPSALISDTGFPIDIVGLALIANSPQVLLSTLYYTYNSVYTAMLMGYEWTSYASKKKGLRVSHTPQGFQRSTYFLQLPYRFGIPLVILSGVLHWLVSQSIFVVAIDVFDAQGNPTINGSGSGQGIRRCGFSPIAMMVVTVLGLFMILALVGFGSMRYNHGMPLARSSSLAISTACHPPGVHGSGEVPMSEQELQWGVVETGVDGIGRCAFSSQEVGWLVKGHMYI